MLINPKIADIIVRENWNIRNKISQKEIDSLAESIKTTGCLINPISINDKSELVAGHRRLLACKRLGWETIPAIKKIYFSETHERLSHIDENIQSMKLKGAELDRAMFERKILFDKLHPMKDGEDAATVVNNDKSFIKDTMDKTGLSRNTIRNKVNRIKDASKPVVDAYTKDELKASQVNEIVKLPKQQQRAIVDDVKGKTIKETKKIIAKATGDEQAASDEPCRIDVLNNSMFKTQRLLSDFLRNPYHQEFGQKKYDRFITVITSLGNVVIKVTNALNEETAKEEEVYEALEEVK